MSHDLKGLLISYAFLFGILILGELIRTVKKYPSEFTRKFIHVGVGLWGFVAYWILEAWWVVLIPPASFVLINLLSYKWTLFKSMEIEDKSNLGTVYYPLSLCILIVVFWRTGDPVTALVGLLVMALGDGFASIIGQAWGRRAYRVWKGTKTLEGSAAMCVFSLIAVVCVLALTTDLAASAILLRGFVVAVLATAVEAVSPRGMDNLTVPLLCSGAYWLFF